MDFKLQSDSVKELLSHYQKALSEIASGVDRDAKSNRGQYTTLDSMLAAVEPVLVKNNLTLNFQEFPYNDIMWLKCIVEHTVSEQFKASYAMLYKTTDITGINSANQQTIGAIITYQSRYLLRSILCIPCIAEDCDEKKNIESSAKVYEQSIKSYECISKEQSNELFEAVGRNKDLILKVAEHCGQKVTYNIPLEDYEKALEIAKILYKQNKGQ